MGDKTKGLYSKFHIHRNDGEDMFASDKHFNCDYFVLDLTHDKHAIPAILAYAESCKKDGYQLLANDLERKVDELSKTSAMPIEKSEAPKIEAEKPITTTENPASSPEPILAD